MPVNLVSNYFPLERLPGLDKTFRAYGREPTSELSFGKLFKAFGIADFRRKSIRVRSRVPKADEARHLQIAPSEHVLETDVVIVDAAETPISYANTCYPISRVEFAGSLKDGFRVQGVMCSGSHNVRIGKSSSNTSLSTSATQNGSTPR